MEFCPKCGTLLVEKRKNFGCPKCNYSSKEKVNLQSVEKMQEKEVVGIVKDKEMNVFPVTNATCRKCGNKEAHFWTVQMRAGDEAETRFFRCTKCKHTWREYR